MFRVSVAGVAIADVPAAELRIGQGKDSAAMLVRLRDGHKGTKTIAAVSNPVMPGADGAAPVTLENLEMPEGGQFRAFC
jgi:hypothetical protein